MRTETRVNGITEGRISSQLLLFFFPILFGTFFQQLYNTVDAIIVGQYLGTAALAAVGGGTGTAINLLIGFFTGLSSGATVIISQYYGAKDYEDTNKAIHTAILIALIGGIAIMLIGILFTRPILELIGTPEDVIGLAEIYMRIYFIGSVFNTVYNMGAGIFRALGDSKKPLYFLIVGCLVNIVLDIVLVGFTPLGVAGAAWATIFSQAVSAVLVIIYLRKLDEDIRLSLRHMRLDPVIVRGTLRIGLPTGIQSILYTISNLIIQANVNAFGTATAAAWAAYGKLDAVFWMAINAFGIAATTFVGQNYGAKLYGRVHDATKFTSVISTFLMVGIAIICFVFARPLIMLFRRDDLAVISIGVVTLRAQCIALTLTGITTVTNMALQSTGQAGRATLLAMCRQGFLFIPIVLILPHFMGLFGVEIAQSLADILTFLVSLYFFITYLKELKAKRNAQVAEDLSK